MPKQRPRQTVTIEQLQRHLKTHCERSEEDRNAVKGLDHCISTGGKIYTNFSVDDKWPNVDGDFELVPDPESSRQPKKKFAVQIKGTTTAHIARDGTVHYQLQDLAFPAYVATEITSDPGIMFVVLNPESRTNPRFFWKYMSPGFIASLDFNKNSATIVFDDKDEIKNTDESVDEFVKKLDAIADAHSYMKQLEARAYGKEDILKMVCARCEDISEMITLGIEAGQTREQLSKRILTYLEDLCQGTLILNGLLYYSPVSLRTAWELSLMRIDTKFLATFLQGLRYIGLRVPEEGQNERLMLKYYGFLWKIRRYLKYYYDLTVLTNLEAFPHNTNEEDDEFNKLLAGSIETVCDTRNPIGQTRYYVQKKTAFYVDTERYFEITLQLADMYATKYNRLTVYTKEDISSNYSIQIGYAQADILLLDKPTKIKVITDWRVSIAPAVMNKLSKIVRNSKNITSRHNEYQALMNYLTQTGISVLDLIDFTDERFHTIVSDIYKGLKTSSFYDTLITLHTHFNQNSSTVGHFTVRYSLLGLREDLLEDILPNDNSDALNSEVVLLSKKCYSFERNPLLYNLPRHKTNGKTVSRDVLRAIGINRCTRYLPYLRIKSLTNTTGELFHRKEDVEIPSEKQTAEEYNKYLLDWDRKQGQTIKEHNGYVYIDEYVQNTVFILRYLLEKAKSGNEGQEQLNKSFVSRFDSEGVDELKVSALKSIFVNSKVAMIYGAAGTGKTTLMNYISDLMAGRSKLFITKTHTALENLQRRIKSPGGNSMFMGIDRLVNSKVVPSFDVIFVDECSTIDNRTMVQLLKKIDSNSLLVLAGDIYQIESIDFGNWFFYAKEILSEKAIVELTGTWRTHEQNLIKLWEEVRFRRPLITEMLVIDGPFSKNIGKDLFERADPDEVVLCLNYDGKFGLNCINNYFQDANPSPDVFYWFDWKYKIGDPVLFNESQRFPMLYNNLKGTIVNIQARDGSIFFTIDIPIVLTSVDVRESDLQIISNGENSTRVRFGVFENDESKTEDAASEEARKKSIVPFQLAYAVSIHKAQGLEYNSIKVVIPSSNSEKITHGVFYTAITRTKEHLKILWSADTMAKVIEGFKGETKTSLSTEMIKPFLE